MSSLVIVEKKPQRVGGCIGVFFQLFDWNRRLAKKKLFSKKFLPAVRSKQSSKKFGGDDKRPKLRLIADENSGGFPNVKKVDHETREPSLVAKLMGLESMPAVQKSRSRKGVSGKGSDRLQKCGNGCKELERKEMILERVDTKNEWRPQKVQKTGLSEKRSVAKFGADPLQSRKHQLPKSCGKNATRLIDVATRILEPGLHKSRDRYALTYSSCHSKYETLANERPHSPPRQPNNSCFHTIAPATPPKRQNPLERPSKPVSPVLHYVDSVVGSASQLENLKRSYDSTASRKPLNKEGQAKWQLTAQQSNSHKDLKQKTQMQNQMLEMKDRKPVKSKSSSVPGNRVSSEAFAIRETKSFAPLSQSFSGHARHGVPGKVDDWKCESERKARIRRKDAMPLVQKKRLTNVHQKCESSSSSSDLSRQTRTKSGDQRRNGSLVKKGNGVDPFTLSSSVSYMSQSHKETEYRGVQKKSNFENICEDVQSTGLPKPLSMSGDALSTLLEEKLKELNSQDEDDFAKGGNMPKKTTAVILQELIFALTTEQHLHDHSVAQSVGELDPCYNHHCLTNTDTSFRFKAQPTSPPASARHESGENHRLSPGSVLEATFSVDSCSSSNQDDVSIPRNKRAFELTSSFNGDQHTWEPDADLLESTTSPRLQISGIFNNVTEMLCSISATETSLEGSKLNHAKGIILDVEQLMLANEGFSISHFLSNELEMLASIIWMSFGYTRAWNHVKGFAFDSVVEYLDSRYTRYSKCGFSVWSRFPLLMDSEMVIQEIVKEIRRWTELSGMVPDNLVEWDMSHSLGKWTDFEVEEFETGVELDHLILQTLVDELVIDLCKCY